MSFIKPLPSIDRQNPATASLLESLNAVRQQLQRLSVLRGIGRVVTASIALIFAYILLDYLLNLPALPRSILFLAALAAVVTVAVRWVVWPIRNESSLSDIAGRLETRFPEFDDGLRSTLDFLRPELPGSLAMKQRTVDQTIAQAGRMNLDSAIDPMPTWIAIAQAGGVFVLFVLIAMSVGPQVRSTAIAHLFDPFSLRPWPRTVEIASDNSIPQRVPTGQPIDVRIKLVRGDRASVRSKLCYQYDNGPVQEELMTRGDGGIYAATLDPRIDPDKHVGNLHVWVKAGDDQLDLAPVTVVPRLTIRSVQARVIPPTYASAEPTLTTDLTAGPASMVEGSRVELSLQFNKPLAEHGTTPNVQLEAVESTDAHAPATQPAIPAIAWGSGAELNTVGRFDASRSFRFHVHAVDGDGFSNAALEEYQLIVRPDQMPSVQIEEPRQNEERTAIATIPLRAVAEDDLGINALTLVVDRLQRGGFDSTAPSPKPATMPVDVSHWTIPLVAEGKPVTSIDWTAVQGTGDRKRFRATDAWDLTTLAGADLRGGDVLEYHLIVSDNYSVNGQTHPPVSSGKLRITLISQEDLTNRTVADLQALKNQIAELKTAQDRTHNETANLEDDLKNKAKLDDADRAAAQRLAAEQSSAAGRAQQIAERATDIGKRLEENQSPQKDLQTLSHDVASDLNDTAENPMKTATQRLGELPNQPDAQKRAATLADAKDSQQQADENLQRALDRLGNIGSLQQTIARINELLKQQRAVGEQTREAGKNTLGKTPDQLDAADRKKLDAAAAAQSKLADQTAKAIEDLKKSADQLAKSDPTDAEAMSKAAQTASQQQVSPNQKKASEQIRQNQQSSAQSAQQQVELGLQMMASDLQQAESRKLAQLSKQLEDLQQQIANLIRRQAGHNLDNLAVQGPAATQPADTVASLTAEAARDASTSPPTDLNHLAATLSPSQEQTSTNARDISRSSESLPDGAAAASQLLRAADHMDRAVISLHDSKYADAYDPPQVEALSSLLAAKKTVDDQKAKVDEQINQSQKETVRQKYVKLKADQEKLNGDVARIDAVRDAATPLKRVDAIRLGQLPGEQGALADRVNELDKDLASIGSIVYTWANHDIASTMTTVKSDLPDAAKDADTIATQSRIVEQLAAMIENLATKPKVSKFANDNQGGGGGGGKGGGAPPLPPEAELRLLRDLQKSVNANTKALDATGTKNPEKAVAIGTRQGDLRRLLEQLLEKSSNGTLKIGPEPDNKDQLPEEASQQDVENNELDQGLLNDKPTADEEAKATNLIGERMARSRQRLALNDDPGKVTQMIQEKVLADFDSLIDQARKQEAEIRNPSPQKGGGQKQSTPSEQVAKTDQPTPGAKQPGKPSVNSAQVSTAVPPGGGAVDLSKQIKESLTEWGQITPRLRAAQIEGSSESIVEQYRKLTEDYYRSLSAKAAQR